MKRIYLSIIAMLFAVATAQAQNQVRVHNNTACPVSYMLYLDNGNCVDAGSVMYSIAPGGQTAHTVTLTNWGSYSTPLIPGAQFSGARMILNASTCPDVDHVTNPCVGGPASTTLVNLCPPNGCPSYNASWVQTAGGGYVLSFN